MTDTREAFEEAYAKAYPFTCGLVPDVFEMDYDIYVRTTVQVGWTMWQAGAQHEKERAAKVADGFAETSQYQTQRKLAKWIASSIRFESGVKFLRDRGTP